jgi:CBS domain containing-hemolysin-like protein
LPEDPAYATVAGLVLHRLGHIPLAGEITVDEESEVTIEVVESTPRRVARVRLRRHQ